jgi:hypothetical protein
MTLSGDWLAMTICRDGAVDIGVAAHAILTFIHRSAYYRKLARLHPSTYLIV